MSISCGKNTNVIALKSGLVYTWGKGDYLKPRFNDNEIYSRPFLLIEDKTIVYVSCGLSHCVALDSKGRIFAWGDGDGGCLGLGDSKKRVGVCQLMFFEDKRCIDIACGDRFTVIVAEVYEDS
jgi:E3 ubiquitin-protein ligase HERC2